MGVVYAGHDDRLDRDVAIKVIRPEALADDVARERFRREARAAARVSHPNICTLYEFDETQGQPFLVMELLDGESLAARIARGAVPPIEALGIALPMLDALAALHRRGIVHRDLKPANVFLTPNGVKLLDFGLAQPPAARSTSDVTREARLTTRGLVVGTPQYMAPEQLAGGTADERADVFAAGVVVYEMIAGRAPFAGRSLPELLRAILTIDPAPLTGSLEIEAVGRVLRDALERDPGRRIARADLLADRLREALEHGSGGTTVPATRVTRFVALPLRVLRPDPDTDFLAFSVPDAISAALAGLQSVIVRSPQAGPPGTDVRSLGRDLAVDVVFTGTILRAGSAVRVTAQLTDAAAGTLIWSDSTQAPISDLFQLQDALTQRIVTSLSLPLTAADRRVLHRQAPTSAEAYELFLRANQLMMNAAEWDVARGLYERAVELDPSYAPAWAGLGRARRVIAKWGGPKGIGLLPQADDAFHRALALDPDLALAHDLSAYAEAELGRAPEAMARLLGRAATRPNDVGLFAGLVTTCRYAGLLDASLAAHDRARAVDAAATTSVTWTHFMRGDYQSAVATDVQKPPFCALLSRMVRGDLQIDEVRAIEERAVAGTRLAVSAYRHMMEGSVDKVLAVLTELRAFGFADPEGWYLYAFMLARDGRAEPALDLLAQAVDMGFACHHALGHQQEWRALADHPRFIDLIGRTDSMVRDARHRFDAAGGQAILGVPGALASTTAARPVGP